MINGLAKVWVSLLVVMLAGCATTNVPRYELPEGVDTGTLFGTMGKVENRIKNNSSYFPMVLFPYTVDGKIVSDEQGNFGSQKKSPIPVEVEVGEHEVVMLVQVDRFYYLVPFNLDIHKNAKLEVKAKQRQPGDLSYMMVWVEDQSTGKSITEQTPAAIQIPNIGPMFMPVFVK